MSVLPQHWVQLVMADTRKMRVAAALHADADLSVRTVRTGGDSFGLPVLAGGRTIEPGRRSRRRADMSEQIRDLVSDSWRRSHAARVDPDHGLPPHVFERREVADVRAGHPLAEVLPLLRDTLLQIADEAMHMMIVT